jgi:hypothetical protein
LKWIEIYIRCPQEKIPLLRPWHKREANIKTNPQEIMCENFECIQVG